jgi:hypothetical protein
MALITTPASGVLMTGMKPDKGIAIFPGGRRAAQVMSQMVAYQRSRSAR